MTKSHLISEVTLDAKLQIGDITQAVKQGEKAIALNDVRNMTLWLNLRSHAIATKPSIAVSTRGHAKAP